MRLLSPLRSLFSEGPAAAKKLAGKIDDFLPAQPVAALAKPGACVLDADWAALPLLNRQKVSRDVMLLTFGLQDTLKPLGLSTCACILARGAGVEGQNGPVRPYTPVSTNMLLGAFQLLVKIYPEGRMSQQLAKLPIGGTVEFSHIPVNVKVQYPFGRKHVVMIAGGSGITPMLQALQAILGWNTDTTSVTLLYSNKEQSDIICRDALDNWAQLFPTRFRVVHTLTREPETSSWRGSRGRIDRKFLQAHLPAASSDVFVFVCGPQPMYETLCGPRGEKEVKGYLADLHYRQSQVVKF